MEKTTLAALMVCAMLVFFLPTVTRLFLKFRRKGKLRNIVSGAKTLSPRQFFDLREQYRGRMKAVDFIGVYIIYNQSKKMYYVGQSIHVLSRVNAHFTGKGNGDVYADYKYGDRFVIRLVKLRGSGYSRLDDLERELIEMYHCCEKGYNRKKGNK